MMIVLLESYSNQIGVLLYDGNKVIKKLMVSDGMSFSEAWEYFEFNILGSYVGECTPAFKFS